MDIIWDGKNKVTLNFVTGDCGNVDSVVIINGVAYARSTKLYTVPMMTAKYMLLKHQATFKFGIAQALFFSMLISISFCAWIALNEVIFAMY